MPDLDIGGVAAMVHNLPFPATVHIDVTPLRDSKKSASIGSMRGREPVRAYRDGPGTVIWLNQYRSLHNCPGTEKHLDNAYRSRAMIEGFRHTYVNHLGEFGFPDHSMKSLHRRMSHSKPAGAHLLVLSRNGRLEHQTEAKLR